MSLELAHLVIVSIAGGISYYTHSCMYCDMVKAATSTRILLFDAPIRVLLHAGTQRGVGVFNKGGII